MMSANQVSPEVVQTLKAAIGDASAESGNSSAIARPSVSAVVQALLAAEQQTRQQPIEVPIEALLGRWRLRFATGTRKAKQGGIALGRGFYLPALVPAEITFFTDADRRSQKQGEITNQVTVGLASLQFSGLWRYEGKKNLLAFDFNQLQLRLLNRSIIRYPLPQKELDRLTRPIAQLPFFAFVCVTEDLIAARGRGGGLALWSRIASPAASG